MKLSESSDAKGTPTDYRNRGVTARILVIALLIAPLNSYFMAYLNGPRGIEDPTVVSLFWNIVFLLFVFRLINAALLRWFPRAAFSPAELISFFILLSVANCTSGQDTLKTTWATMMGAFKYASPENHWQDLFIRYIPHGMVVSDTGALDRLWNGDSSIFDKRNYLIWVGPMFRWWLFYVALWTAPVGLSVILRRRWVDRERMSFPIVQLPLELTKPRIPLLRHPAFWVAVGITVCINTINGLHSLYPAVPLLPIKIWSSDVNNLEKFFVGRPWNAIGTFYVCFYPFIIGLGLLLPQELSFSLWFFYLFWKAEAIVIAWMGLDKTPEFPYMKEQSFGGYIAILGFSLWAARGYLRDVWHTVLRPGSVRAADKGDRNWGASASMDEHEAMSYRTAVLIFLGCLAYLVGVGLSQKMASGVVIAFFVQYYFMTLIVGRIRAEMGMPTHELERLGPTVMQGNILGVNLLGVQNLTGLSLFFGFTRGIRNIPLPHQFESLYLSEKTGGDPKRLLWASMLMIPVGLAGAYFWNLYLGYKYGLGAGWAPWMQWSCTEAWNQLGGWLGNPQPVQWGRIAASGIGFGVYFGLMLLRTRWVWWPLHPAGFALSTTWYMAHMWTPMLIAWLLKRTSVRYLGRAGIRALMSAAFGLILGDIITGSFWLLWGLAFHVPTYAFWP